MLPTLLVDVFCPTSPSAVLTKSSLSRLCSVDWQWHIVRSIDTMVRVKIISQINLYRTDRAARIGTVHPFCNCLLATADIAGTVALVFS